MTRTRPLLAILVLALGIACASPSHALHTEEHRQRQELFYLGFGAAAAVAIVLYVVIDGMTEKESADARNRFAKLWLLPPNGRLEVVPFDQGYPDSIAHAPLVRLTLSF